MDEEDKTVSSITIRYTDGTVASLVGEDADAWKQHVNECIEAAMMYTPRPPYLHDVDWEITEEGP